MEITLFQGILLTLLIFICAWDSTWETFFIFRPIVVSFFAGIILGDVQLGLAAGAITELAYLGLLTVGGTVPPNPLIAGLMTVVIAYKGGVSAETALGLSLPFAILMQTLNVACNSLFSFFNRKLDHYARLGDTKKFRFYVFLPEIIRTTIYAIVAFLSAYALQDVLGSFVESLPGFLTHGFEIAGGLLPGVGLALLLRVMLNRENWPYLVVGFLLMTFLDLENVLPVALVAIVVAYLGYLNDRKKRKEISEEADINDGI